MEILLLLLLLLLLKRQKLDLNCKRCGPRTISPPIHVVYFSIHLHKTGITAVKLKRIFPRVQLKVELNPNCYFSYRDHTLIRSPTQEIRFLFCFFFLLCNIFFGEGISGMLSSTSSSSSASFTARLGHLKLRQKCI